MDVLRQAIKKNCNLIICHEPLYFNGSDDTRKLQNDSVYLEKHKFIADHKLVIWRFYDYIHSLHPDGITTGMVNKLGWKEFVVNERLNQFVFPPTTLAGLLGKLKKTFPQNSFQVVGDPQLTVSKVILSPGYSSEARYIPADVLIIGEA